MTTTTNLTNLTTATDDQIEQLRLRAVNETTRGIARTGIRLTWDQADDLGDMISDWMRKRLDLRMTTDHSGVTFCPREGYLSETDLRGARYRIYECGIDCGPVRDWSDALDEIDDASHGDGAPSIWDSHEERWLTRDEVARQAGEAHEED